MRTTNHLRSRAASMAIRPTYHEKLLSARLKAAKVPHKTQVVLGWYIADVVIPSKLLILEVDGPTHWTARGRKHDERRDAFLQAAGFHVLHIPVDEVRAWPLARLASFMEEPRAQYWECVGRASAAVRKARHYATLRSYPPLSS